jgi:hypothetical protein
MRKVQREHKGAVEEDLFRFHLRDTMLFVSARIARVPIEADDGIERDHA